MSMLQQVREEYPIATKVVGVGLAVAGGAVLAPAVVVGGAVLAPAIVAGGAVLAPAIVAGGAVLAPATVVVGLNAIGFTATGVAGGSIAAGLQSVIYGGATTGLFSLCQSIGATGTAPAVSSVISAAGGVIAGAVPGVSSVSSAISGAGVVIAGAFLGSGSENNQGQGSDTDGHDTDGHDSEAHPPPPCQA